MCWYFSHIVQYSISYVVMLFPPEYFHFMCAGIPHTFLFHCFISHVMMLFLPDYFSFYVCWFSSHTVHYFICNMVTHSSLFHQSCGDTVSATVFSFYACWYPSHIVHYSNSYVVILLLQQLFPYFPMCSHSCINILDPRHFPSA